MVAFTAGSPSRGFGALTDPTNLADAIGRDGERSLYIPQVCRRGAGAVRTDRAQGSRV